MKYDQKSKTMMYSNKELKHVHGISPAHKALEKKKEGKAAAYDAKHGKDAHHYRYTKHGRAQAKAYDAYFGLNK